MARKRKKADKKKLLYLILGLVAIIIAGISRADYGNINTRLTLEDGNVAIHFVDVGQGNCTVIQKGNEAVMIDAGEKEYASVILDFFEDNGITYLKYVVATHPHSDHIGGMAAVIETVKTEKIYFPDIIDKYAPTSKTYLNLLESVYNNGVDAVFTDKNLKLDFNGIELTLIAPVEQVNDFNNMSLLTKVKFGEISAMLLADAENRELESILQANPGFDFSSDIYLVPHHGSETSLHKGFFGKVDAMNAVISCGVDNSYGHPHREVEEYLQSNNIRTFRTDEDGTITLVTDGKEYNVITEKGIE